MTTIRRLPGPVLRSSRRLATLCAVVGLGLAASPAAAQVIFSDNFNRANSSTVGNGWVETESSGNDATINSNRLVFVTNNVDNVPRVQHTFMPVSSGVIRWTFVLDWARASTENFYSIFMQLGNSGAFGTPPADGSSVAGAAINLRWGDDNFGFPNEEGFGYVQGSTQTQVAVLTGLHTIEVIANLDAQTFDIRIDGATAATGIAFDKSLGSIGGSIDAVRLYQGEGISSGTGGNQAFDDVTIQWVCVAAALPFTDDFNRPNSSTVGNGWTEIQSSGNDATINSNRLVFVTNNTDNVPRVQHCFTPVSSGYLRWAFSLDWTRASTENFYSVFMQLGNSGAFGTPPADGSSVAGAAVNLRWGDDNWGFVNEGGFGYVRGTTQTQVAALSGLHTIEVIVNLSAETYTIKIDGATAASGIAFDKSLASIGGSIDAVRLYQGEGISSGTGGNQAFDDVTIQTVTYVVAVTPDGADTLSRLPSNGTGYSYAYTVTNSSTVTEDFDLFGEPGDPAATVFTVDSIRGTNVTQAAADPDSARLASLGAGASATVTVWYRVADAAAGTRDSLYLRGRSVINVNASDRGWFFVRVVKPNLSTSKSVSPSGTQAPGTELTYTVAFTNGGSADGASVVIVDSLATEIQFKVNSVVSNLPGGITAVVEYSNDGGSSWTYTPVSGGCSAPVDFDGCVNRVRWTFQNPLSSVAPNNTGDVRLVARIK